jgi:hypothetical protein
MSDPVDPILVKRERVRFIVNTALRAGSACYGVTIVAFAVAVATDFSGPLTAIMTATLILGSVLLAPAMVFHYALKAADRADREGSW